MNNPQNAPPPSEQELFTSLVESAFEFLNKALDEFPQSAKFSTVHFAVAIELFLKARLMKEHWALLFQNPGKASRTKFLQGEAFTVTPDMAIVRLEEIAGERLPSSSKEAFGNIAKHRNKMVHFVHEASFDANNAQGLVTQVVSEQCRGWLGLNNLLQGDWAPHFQDFTIEIAEISTKMGRHRHYLDAKFSSEAVSSAIAEHTARGNLILECPSCSHPAVPLPQQTSSIQEAACLVCGYEDRFIQVPCSECAEQIVFASENPLSECPACQADVAVSVREGLDTGEPVTPDNYFDHTEKNCPYCMGYHTVVEHEDRYICTDCYEESEILETCEYCSEAQLGGVPEYSFLTGCEFCPGREG